MTSRRQSDLPVMHFGEEANRLLAAQAPVMAAVKEWVEAKGLSSQVEALRRLRAAWKLREEAGIGPEDMPRYEDKIYPQER